MRTLPGRLNNISRNFNKTNVEGQVYHLKFNLNSYIEVGLSLNNEFNSLLLDTGADISLIKINKIMDLDSVERSCITNISGIGSDVVRSCGMVDADIKINKFCFSMHFTWLGTTSRCPMTE